MRIPNKFNGYFADGRRLYNDPATVTVTLAGMEGAATTAATIEALGALGAGAGALSAGMTGAALAPEAAAAMSQAPQLATAISAGAVSPEVAGAGQGIMQGAAAAPTAPGMAAAPATPLTPPPPAGGDVAAFAADQTMAGAGAPVNPTMAPPPAPPAGGPPTGGIAQAPQAPGFGQPDFVPPSAPGGVPGISAPVQNIAAASPPPASEGGVMNSLEKGFNAARDFAKGAYEEYKKAPMPLQAIGAMTTYQKFMAPEQKGPSSYKGKPVNMSGFHTSTPSPYLYGFADGGSIGPVERMSQANAVGANTMYPMAQQQNFGYASYAAAPQRPVSQNMLEPEGEMRTDAYTGEPKFAKGGTTEEEDKDEAKRVERQKYYASLMSTPVKEDLSDGRERVGIIRRSRAQELSSPATAAQAEMAAMMKKYGIKSALPKVLDPQGGSMAVEEAASGGIMHGLGGYSDGGRLLKGPGDGVSDSIPAVIGSKQPARLADGEFVIPARIVSELGNGSTDAGARKLYAMMDRVQKGRKKSVGKDKVAVDSKADKHLPA